MPGGSLLYECMVCIVGRFIAMAALKEMYGQCDTYLAPQSEWSFEHNLVHCLIVYLKALERQLWNNFWDSWSIGATQQGICCYF